MKFSLLLPAFLLAARICAQDSSAVTQPLKNVGLFAGAGYAWLDLDAGPLDTADSLMQSGTVTGFGSPGISVGVFGTFPLHKLELRPSVCAMVYSSYLEYDFLKPVKERNDVHPFSAGVTLDITRGLGAANVGDVKKWTPVLGAEYLYAIPLFDGDHPDKVSADLRIRAGFGLKTRHANEKGYVQRSHLELVLSWQVNNLVVPGDDVYTAPVNRLYKHMLELRYYFQ